jgi:WhiB family transcriptional regulator, redox-sensing transcriptional regulator
MDLTWQSQASCIGEDPELFFDEHKNAREQAIEICLGCPVMIQCGDWNRRIEAGTMYHYGVFGGLTSEQRRSGIQKRTLSQGQGIRRSSAYQIRQETYRQIAVGK